jgi:hypothetical protein
MTFFLVRKLAALSAFLCFAATVTFSQDVPTDYQDVLKLLDRKGDFKAGVLKVNIPRNDLKMTIQAVRLWWLDLSYQGFGRF